MQTQLNKETELKTGIILMKRTQYNDALDTFLKIIHHFPKYLFSILIPIYKYLILHFNWLLHLLRIGSLIEYPV